ncbi:oxygen-independent coproporphyrinogen III oxidase [Helicobacter ailurogastricus]|uniref:oxygen-independent coproporphyrinogen III oxidase n=1 Tax=Helicobacter ailurogastricus TaxID=1578720 RepID=UPI00244D8103|nr:oxygen-independent coproporphyrinogen III oxidase [Helicobacter ailurogastricus]GMB91304.1 Coproporphyrinogen III oxidase HemN [Helicobacter ailurogastricus]
MQDLDFNKFASYSKPGPRYTSYPTAVEFNPSFQEADLLEAFQRADQNIPLSLYFHLPFCKSACYFCACNVIYTNSQNKKERYIGYLGKELELLKQHLDTQREVVQLHFGGGTPTFYNAEQLDRIITSIQATFPNFSKEAELSCEIDPRHFSLEQMQVLKEHGFNRLSFGVQDFDPQVQVAVNRLQSVDLVAKKVQIARDFGITSINFDLIYGLPLQTIKSFEKTLLEVLKLNPDRLAVFNYAHVPWVKHTMKIDPKTLPSPQEKLALLQFLIGFLKGHGYEMIGMDHFAKKDNELYKALQNKQLRRNFQGYTTKKFSQTIGVGVTSIGEGQDYYTQNFKDLKRYEQALDSGHLPVERGIKLSAEDRLRKEVIMHLMNNLELDFRSIEEAFAIDFKTHFKDALDALKPYEQEGLVAISEEGLTTSPTGAMLVRNLAMVFDAYLGAQSGARRFSQTL